MLYGYNDLSKMIGEKGFNYIKIEMEAGLIHPRYNTEDYDYLYNKIIDKWHENLSSEANRAILFEKIYGDGADTGIGCEITFTIKIDDIKLLPQMLKMYHKTLTQASESHKYELDNAGMHITLMAEGNYDRLKNLPRSKIVNFRKSMNKIINSMYVIACQGKLTRRLEYREPYVCDTSKYTAIYTHNDTCIEYRIFDPCYDNPHRVKIYLNAINKTLQFYSNQLIQPIVEDNDKYNIFTDDYKLTKIEETYSKANIKRFFDELEYLYPNKRILNKAKKNKNFSEAIKELASVGRRV